MSERMSVKEFNELKAKGQWTKKGRLQVADFPPRQAVGAQPEKKANKYGAIKVPDPEGGPDFDSTLESKHAAEYRAMAKAGLLMSVARGALVLLGAGITWKIDFILHHHDGTVEYVDSKGKDTPDFILKEKLFREKYPHLKLTIRRAKGKK
jgi:hypothetical protein